jgi:putative ABC transport system ATP-binding protein
VEQNLFRYILRFSLREQVVVLAIVLVSMVFYFLSLDLPKTIVNGAIQGKGFPTPDSTTTFGRISLPWPGDGLVVFDGIEIERLPYLFTLSGMFLLLVLINNAFKYYINTYKGRMGERMLRRLRYELFERITRFPLHQFRRLKPSEMATMIKDEVEPLGGFIGDALVTPAFLGGQVITALIFIMVQHLSLGLVAIGVMVLQVVLIPKMRRRVLVLGRERQLTARQLSGRIAEFVDGVQEVRSNGATNWERADISGRLGRIFVIRFEIYQRKFLAKLVNNFLAQVTPFVFYAAGGYFAIRGVIDIGALVAIIAAYKDLPGPLKELIDWDQQRLDVQIKYEQVVSQFAADRLLPADDGSTPPPDTHLAGSIAASNVAFVEETGVRLIDGATFETDLASRTALVGPSTGGRSELAMIAAGLHKPSGGSLRIGDTDVATAPEALLGRRIAYVGPQTYLFPLSLRDNLLYALRHHPMRPAVYEGDRASEAAWHQAEAIRTGNTTLDANADWIDYAAARVDGAEGLEQRLDAVLHAVTLDDDLLEFGLRSVVDPEKAPDVAEAALALRRHIVSHLQGTGSDIVVPFDPARYNAGATIGENLLFGLAVGEAFQADTLALQPYVRQVLDTAGLSDELFAMGVDAARTMVEMFADLPPGHEFFERYSLIRHDELPAFRALLADVGKAGALDDAQRAKFTSLGLQLRPSHRLADLDAAFQERIVAARGAFAADLPADLRPAMAFFEPAHYLAPATLRDNILFGKVAPDVPNSAAAVDRLIRDTLEETGQRRMVLGVGLEFSAGVGGQRLTVAQRQKIGFARALLKRPDLLVVNEATGSLEAETEAKVLDAVFAEPDCGVLWSLSRKDLIARFDSAIYVAEGKVAEYGSVTDLRHRPNGYLHKLIGDG